MTRYSLIRFAAEEFPLPEWKRISYALQMFDHRAATDIAMIHDVSGANLSLPPR